MHYLKNIAEPVAEEDEAMKGHPMTIRIGH
jgi:hypothetical protein